MILPHFIKSQEIKTNVQSQKADKRFSGDGLGRWGVEEGSKGEIIKGPKETFGGYSWVHYLDYC